MNTPLQRALLWSPRLLGVGFALFLGLFALDAFDGQQGFWPTLAAFALHLIPTIFLLGVVGLAWRWPWVGGVVCTSLGVLYVVMTHGRFHWSAYLLISGSLWMLGALFFLSWGMKRWSKA